MARKAIYVTEERHQAIKAGAVANCLTIEAYMEKLLQMAQPMKKQSKIIEA